MGLLRISKTSKTSKTLNATKKMTTRTTKKNNHGEDAGIARWRRKRTTRRKRIHENVCWTLSSLAQRWPKMMKTMKSWYRKNGVSTHNRQRPRGPQRRHRQADRFSIFGKTKGAPAGSPHGSGSRFLSSRLRSFAFLPLSSTQCLNRKLCGEEE